MNVQIMSKDQAAKRGLYVIDRVTGKRVPFTTWRVELTKEQKEAEQKQVEAGILPF